MELVVPKSGDSEWVYLVIIQPAPTLPNLPSTPARNQHRRALTSRNNRGLLPNSSSSVLGL